MHHRVPQSVTSTRPIDAIESLLMRWLACLGPNEKVLEILNDETSIK
jgi:hypothetical protein